MDKNFWSDWAVYKGRNFRCTYYANNIVKLFDEADELKGNAIYTVKKDELEDSYSLSTSAILNGVEYKVYEIENDTLIYKKCLNKDELTKNFITDFDLIYSEKSYSEYKEREIIYIDEKQKNKGLEYRNFWMEENEYGGFEFGAVDGIISVEEMNEALEEIYGGRIVERTGGGPGWFVDYQSQVCVDGIWLKILSDFGIVTISSYENGRKYISEITDYFEKRAELFIKQKKIKSVVVSSSYLENRG